MILPCWYFVREFQEKGEINPKKIFPKNKIIDTSNVGLAKMITIPSIHAQIENERVWETKIKLHNNRNGKDWFRSLFKVPQK